MNTKKQQMLSNNYRDQPRASNHRSGHTQSRGQSRGAQRGTEEKMQGTRASLQRGDPSTYNTIQHQKNVLPVKPTAQMGNFVQGFGQSPG